MPNTNPYPDDAAAPRNSADGHGPILVFGATGQQGGAVSAALRARGWPVRAFVRDPGSRKAKALADIGVELTQGELSDPGSIRSAMFGAYGVFSVQPNSGQNPSSGLADEDEIRFGRTIADIALEVGVKHLVYSSAIVVSKGPTGVPNLDCKLKVEAHLRGLALRSTVIRSGTFMELLLQPGAGLEAGAFSFFVEPDQTTPLIAVDDIGQAVASVFEDRERFGSQAINLAGDAPTGRAIGTALSRAAGRQIRYQRYPEKVLAANPVLARLVPVFEPERWEMPDIGALNRSFGGLLTFEAWLAGPGKQLLQAALQTTEASARTR